MESFDTVTAKALEPKELILTCQGLRCINWDCSDTDFEFVVGDDKVCRVHSVLAEFLSPKVARVRRCDPFSCVYTFKNSELFEVFESLVSSLKSGRPLSVEKSNFPALLRLSQELENSELLSSLLGMINTESLTLEEAILLLRAGIDLGTAFSDRLENLNNFIASHFYEIKKEILETLDLETLQLLLSSPSLKIEDEDSLYDFVRSRSETDLRFTSLFELIYFEYLSVNRIENFANFASENLLENINSGLWTRICRRLILETKLNEKKNPRVFTPPGIEFVYDSSKPLDGIIAHLTRECGGNVHDKGIVNATSNSVSGSNQPRNLVDFETNSYYHSNNEKNTWICYEFKNRRVTPTSYSVRSYYNAGSGSFHLKSWVIEVSNDGTENSWLEIDRRDNNSDLNAANVTRNFKISNVPRESFKFIRLRQTGVNHRGDDYLIFHALEIFGTLFDE